MGDRIRSERDGPSALLTVLARNQGNLPVGYWFDKRGFRHRVHLGTAKALVRRGHAKFVLGSGGEQRLQITEEGSKLTDHLNLEPPDSV